MNLKQSFRMAFKSIRSNRVRSLLTMLGIIIGVAAVIIMVSVVRGSNQQLRAYYERLGNNRITVSAQQWGGRDISQTLYDYCLSLGPLVLGVTPDATTEGPIIYRDKNTEDMENGSPTIKLGSAQFSLCNNFQIEKGRDLCQMDVQSGQQVVVLGERAARYLFNYQNPVGKTVLLHGHPFEVVGVYRAKDPDSEYSMDNMAVVPYTLNRLLNRQSTLDAFTVRAASSAATAEVSSRVSGFLKGQIDTERGFFSVYSENQDAKASDDQNRMMSMVLGGIAAISLLVGGIGIMNIMLVTVTERTREIGIRKAIGARRKSILAQFLIEASVVCGIGGLLGIALGVAGTLIAGQLILRAVILPDLPMSAGAFLFSVAMGVGFGMYPAAKASKLQPVVALRAD